jgi:hypothetical protein
MKTRYLLPGVSDSWLIQRVLAGKRVFYTVATGFSEFGSGRRQLFNAAVFERLEVKGGWLRP